MLIYMNRAQRFSTGMVILSFLLTMLELLYLILNTLCYLYHTPRYHACWAACGCCIERTSAIANDPLYNPAFQSIELTTKEETTTCTKQPYSVHVQSASHLDVPFIFDPEKTSSKQRSFVFYGAETLTHCICLIIFLVFCTIYCVIRLKMEYLTTYGGWRDNTFFCRYATRVRLFVVTPPIYCFFLFVCAPSLRIEYERISNIPNAPNRHFILVPIVSMICFIICCVVQTASRITIEYDVYNDHTCAPIGGFGSSEVAIFGGMMALMEIRVLLHRINGFQKRICIPSVTASLAFCAVQTMSFVLPNTMHMCAYDVMILMFVVYAVIWVNCSYLVMMCIYPDWKQRLCAFKYYCCEVHPI
eukprot:430035_1